MLTTKQLEVIKKYWKRGWFNSGELIFIFSTESSRQECINRFLAMGLIYEDNFKFIINREKFLELQEE